MSNSYDLQYKEAINKVLNKGTMSGDRTGTGTIKTFDYNFNVDLRCDEPDTYYIPILTLRKVFPRVAFEELMWMMRGDVDVKKLQRKKVHIWDHNSSREFLDSVGLQHIKENFIGRAYGYQMRNFNGVDQLVQCYNSLLNTPNSRRHMISFWNPSELKEMALPPCHYGYNFMVEGKTLHLKFIMRSNDLILGQPTNIMFATFWLSLFAKALNLEVGEVACSVTDMHIYNNHIDVAKELLEKETFPMAKFKINKDIRCLNDILYNVHWEDIEIIGYDYNPKIDKERLIVS